MALEPGRGSFLDTSLIINALGVTPGMHVADLGCGSGYLVVALAKAVGSAGVAYAVDVQEGSLESARAKIQAAGLGNVREVRADLEVIGGTGIPDGELDLALLANTLFQSSKRDAMVKEAARMIKSGGRLGIIEWRPGASVFGPPVGLRIPEDQAKQLGEAAGLKLQGNLDVGTYCYGLVFLKP